MIEVLPRKLEDSLSISLGSNERVAVKLRGTFKEALVCTNIRVLIIKTGWMTGQLFGTNTFQCPYSNVAGAQVKFDFVTGYFELSAGGMQNTPKSFWNTEQAMSPARAPNCVSISGRTRAALFQKASSFIMERTVPSPYRDSSESLDVLERLGTLRNSGVISEEEYLLKKRQILNRI